ncbi:MAG: hypothetical protein N0A16_02175 [Blastocatellia bacterium]|nr:hypothetical protein [Blastocatellia bacterium]MCS7156520.1 hypothetical protein [Blastocatellia bacterium]MCX7751739.1 hypothetical protein [Blastocatellia bacterium]MDW8168840.1 hypothetical protein [Acidobacteriota bacterium]MDW8257446.1 hypothetical protein [Acidobacteriota bacterium]
MRSRGCGHRVVRWGIGCAVLVLMVGAWTSRGSAEMADESVAESRGPHPLALKGENPPARAILGEVIIVGDGLVRLNGVPIFWGSAVVDGSDIETTSSMAFVRLRDSRGVIFIGPTSRVRIARERSRVRVRVLYGEATIRSQDEIEVEGPDRSLRLSPRHGQGTSKGAAIYSLFVREERLFVRPVDERSRSSETLRAIAPEMVAGLAMLPLLQRDERARVGYSPGPMLVPDVTERPPLVIQCRAEKLFGYGLRVVGRVALGTTPIGGAPVIVRVLFRNRLPSLTVMNVVTGADGPFLGHYQALFAATPADLAAGGVVEVVTQVGREIATNRCGF